MMHYKETTPSLTHHGVMGMKWGIRKDGMPQGYQGSGKTKSSSTIGASKVSKMASGSAKSSGIPAKKTQTSMLEDMLAVNAGLKTAKRSNNCMYCTTAYDLRRRGLDVKAGKTSVGTDFDIVKEWYKDAEPKATKPVIKDAGDTIADHYRTFLKNPKAWESAKKTNQANVESELVKQGDGARGNIGIWWEAGGGHSLVYEVHGKKVHILDTQAGKELDNTELFSRVSPAKEVNYCRTDNKEPNYDVLKKYGIIEAEGVKQQKVSRSRAKEIRNYRNEIATKKASKGNITEQQTVVKVGPGGSTRSGSSEKIKKAAEAGQKAAQAKYSKTEVHAIDARDVDAGRAKAKAILAAIYLSPVVLSLAEVAIENSFR